MNKFSNQKAGKSPRVLLTEPMRKRLTEEIMNDSVPVLAKRTGLPYLLIYNIVHRRIKSLSARHYRIIFGQAPPTQAQAKTDGTHFRQLVELWLFLNDDVTKVDLYREFYGHHHTQKVDYRIFTGRTQSVDLELVGHMEKKFSESGIDRDTVRRWIREIVLHDRQTHIAYERVRPLLLSLKDTLGIHPAKVLNQNFQRYESGHLKNVSRKVYDKVLALKKKADKALAAGSSRLDIERLREEIYGRKTGYTLYTEVEEELKFLKQYARKSPKHYLGRGIGTYANGKCRRLASWRAQKILKDCRTFIIHHPHLPVRGLPQSFRKHITNTALSVFKARIVSLLLRDEGIRFEKQVLRPSNTGNEYRKQIYGFTRFDMAGNALGMKKKAFDLMVAENCEIFRKIGIYSRRWYLSNLYLQELSRKQYFDIISTKYEWLAQKSNPTTPINACMN